MNSNSAEVKAVATKLETKLSRYFGCTPKDASPEQMYKATAMTVKDILTEKRKNFKDNVNQTGSKRVYYMCMEFLLGRSLKTNLHNLGVVDAYKGALKKLGFDIEKLYELEPDAGLGNGGLGRLAACFMDSLASLDYPATGFSLCYEYGLFKQKIIDGLQIELPDIWLPGGEVWLVPRTDRTFKVSFGGQITEKWVDNHCEIVYNNCDTVEAVPYDMMISGADSEGVGRLRLWKARDITNFNMSLFSQGQYAQALADSTRAETLSKVLYPSDNHVEGKLLRLKQQYFLVSASIQSILRDHLAVYGTLNNLSDKVAIHINDTHPALCIPELMRILVDDYRYDWDDAWHTVINTVSYTNHTVLPEALETWDEQLFALTLPRMHMIIKEINERFCKEAWDKFPSNWEKISGLAILFGGRVRMANLAVIGSHAINGVSKIHSDILVNSVFKDFYKLYPERFTNVTNGIAHRRWLCYSNPELTKLIDDCIGDGYKHNPRELENFRKFEKDDTVLARLGEIKHNNKVAFANKLKAASGQIIDPNSIFDVQIKRLHEYKRQLLNALNIINTYLDLKENPKLDIIPQTYIFGAKAAPGYDMAKRIIKLICLLGQEIEKDPIIREKLRVVFLENYSVSMAEALVPAAEISQQISLAGKEASGTGCMKLMINGALTIGTLDGANIEMREKCGKENMFIFGLNCNEVDELWSKGYRASDFYYASLALKRTIDRLNVGFAGESFSDIAQYLIAAYGVSDPYMCLADFESYKNTHDRAISLYPNQKAWNKMSINNIAGAGEFAADRSIEEYAQRIWHLNKVVSGK